jgi:hypothetical protein
MREIGQHGGDVLKPDCLVGSVDALGKLIQSQAAVTT